MVKILLNMQWQTDKKSYIWSVEFCHFH